MTQFLQMGGYGLYVWPAYGLSFLVMLTLLLGGARALRRRRLELQRLKP
jgi:heme exporter protein CcmD